MAAGQTSLQLQISIIVRHDDDRDTAQTVASDLYKKIVTRPCKQERRACIILKAVSFVDDYLGYE